MKTYSSATFFKHTYCEFTVVHSSSIEGKVADYSSKGGSLYYYTDSGVFRYSNHWGRVANCRWKLIADSKIQSQKWYLAYAKWTDFYAINTTEKLFYLEVDFKTNTVDFHHKNKEPSAYVYSLSEAIKRKRKLKQLLKDDKWMQYIEGSSETLREKIICAYCHSSQSFQEIKKDILTQ